MGRAGVERAVARLRPLRHVSFLSAIVGPGAGSQEAYKDTTNPFTSVEENFGRLIGRNREAQLGVGRNARLRAHLARASKDFHYFTGACLTNALGAASRSEAIWV